MKSFLVFFFRQLRPHWGKGLLIFLALCVEIVYNTGVSLSFKFLIDDALIPRNQTVLWWILGLLLLGIVIVFFVGLGLDYLYARLCVFISNKQREQMFCHLQKLSLDYYARTNLSDITSRFSTDLAAVENALAITVSGLFLPFLEMLGNLAVLFFLEWRLALVSLLIVPFSLLGPDLLERRAMQASYARKQQESAALNTVQETFSSPMLMKAFGLEAYLHTLFAHRLQSLASSSVRVGFLSACIKRSSGSGFLLTYVLVTGYGAYLTFDNSMTIGAFMSFQAVFLSASWSLAAAVQNAPALVQAGGGLQRINELFTEIPLVEDCVNAADIAPLKQRIEFKNITFTYPKNTGRPNLLDVNCTIPAGEYVAIVGASGSGKSTLLQLLARFYDAQIGQVCIDGQDLRQVSQASWRSGIGFVFQDNFLFNISLRENIRLAKADASDADIEAAAKMAELHDFIQTLPDGYDTLVGERGGHLSGGQKQRVALARALLRHPKLLLLDELTSALDVQTEAAINATLAHITKGLTVVSVTHRLESAKQADCILVLDKGCLAERGTHTALLAQNGLYTQLWSKQSGFAISEDGSAAEVDAHRLSDIPLFADLDEALLQALATRFVTERYPAERIIFQQDDPADKFYIVVRGSVKVTAMKPSGNTQELAVLEDGDYFGEIALVRNLPRNATVTTRTPCILLTLVREQFQQLLETAPDIRQRLETEIDLRLDEHKH
ncbi:MAG: ATP-binding cassette domain-containing protein [Gammaproteobacteria bacterium]